VVAPADSLVESQKKDKEATQQEKDALQAKTKELSQKAEKANILVAYQGQVYIV